MDLKRVCQSAITRQNLKQEFASLPLGLAKRVATTEMVITFTSSGTELACTFDTRSASSTDAHLLYVGKLDDNDMQRIREKGLCN